MTPAASASSPQGTAWRVLTIPTLPKYTARNIKVVSVEPWKIQDSRPTKESGPYVVMASTINPRAPLPLKGFISAVGSAPTKSLSIPHSFTALPIPSIK